MLGDRFIQELRRAREELPRAFVAAVEDRARHAQGYISRVLGGAVKKLDAETILAVLEHPWIDARALLEQIGIDLSLSPMPYLMRIECRSIRDPLVERVVQREHVGAAQGDDTLLEELAAINELQFSDLPRASAQLLALLRRCPGASRSTRARMLASYAEDRRRHTRFPESAHALRHAFEFSASTVDRVDCLQAMSLLASSQGWYETAEAFAKQGVDLCIESDNDAGLGKLLFTQSVMCRAQGKVAATEYLCQQSLSHLPDGAWTYRFSVYLDLAWSSFELGEYSAAAEHLNRAEAAHKTKQGINWLKAVHFRGTTALAQNEPKRAERSYRQVLAELDPKTEPLFVAITSLFLCKALWQQGCYPEIVEIAEGMIPLLLTLAENEVAAAAILHFYDYARKGKLTLATIEDSIATLEESGCQKASTRIDRR